MDERHRFSESWQPGTSSLFQSIDGGEVPKMNFTLLSFISQTRAAGLTQPEAAKRTGQDPRSFPGRTKLLVDLGLM